MGNSIGEVSPSTGRKCYSHNTLTPTTKHPHSLPLQNTLTHSHYTTPSLPLQNTLTHSHYKTPSLTPTTQHPHSHYKTPSLTPTTKHPHSLPLHNTLHSPGGLGLISCHADKVDLPTRLKELHHLLCRQLHRHTHTHTHTDTHTHTHTISSCLYVSLE